MFSGLIDNYTQSVLIFAGIHVIAAYSFFAPFKTGQVSLGQAGFMGIGAYASAILTQKMGLPFAVALPFGGLVAGIVGIVVGFPALRIKGVYLLLLTLGFSEIVQVVILSWDYTGGAQGFRNIPFNPNTFEWCIGLIVLLMIFFARLERSSLGRAMDAIEQDETAAEVMGIDVVRIKLLAFGIGAAIAGVAGALFAHHTTYVDSTTFNILLAVEILTYVVVGGGSTFWGPALGAFVLTLLPEFLRTLRDYLELVPTEWTDSFPINRIYDFLYGFLDFENAKRLIAYGLILMAMMIVRPDGLLTRDSMRWASFARWRNSRD
ncbi:MAG TPA: branched-chain amino acid ABC transporter permease [Pseudolabrys sp.]|jgi:branched-chain amino acid transport system permease protein|nr:branched-chain amino acid ABC transporter permease [Pseudolabrys sp.]